MSQTRSLTRAALLGCATLLGAATAHARSDIYWSIGINAPLDPYGASIGTVISNAPRHYHYAPPPVIVQPAPIYYRPAPIYYRPAPVYYAPPPVVWRPRPIYHAQPIHVRPGHGHRHPHWKHDRRDDWRDRHPRRHGRD